MAPRVERKLAAILATDVVSYSRLVGADEAGTIARLRALRQECIEPMVAEDRGRLVKLMGDGALVEFASAVDAIEGAVAIQNDVWQRPPDHRSPCCRSRIARATPPMAFRDAGCGPQCDASINPGQAGRRAGRCPEPAPCGQRCPS
jgi:class 3 adenylate cyclase